ncbi:aspartyl-phosphate phosphatase Spo0E family protein [Oceanobacillus salinisoli]|uniref:aspartyl-phosphate phosphatase Spo0E family protein n=1 Tax=Oceanobacillus salinisoli TaxID=2678611 RepID=UPI001E4B53A6|nr:aspartyl-phosphate phosphatase Spo0E family protein [Oceanobacillus salinisoli]
MSITNGLCYSIKEIKKGGFVSKTMSAADNILTRIEYLRKKMSNIAISKGYTDLESVAISQELDRLLNLYENIKEKNIKG